LPECRTDGRATNGYKSVGCEASPGLLVLRAGWIMVTLGDKAAQVDGPNEVHLRTPARHELGKAKANAASTAAYFFPPDEGDDA